MNVKISFADALAMVLIGCVVASQLAFSLLTGGVVIPNTGKIAQVNRGYPSEIRGVFVHCMSFENPDWNLIMQTCSNYGINRIYGEFLDVRSATVEGERITQAMTAAHAKGMQLHLSMDVLITPRDDQPELWMVDDAGNPYPWTCPTKQATRSHIKSLVEDLVRNYAIDGFMFDYIRYETAETCYCSECRAKFLADTGLTNVNWRSDVVFGGKYHDQFMEWRIKPVTELVRDMRAWMLAIKPSLEFSVASWTLFQDSPTYWRYWLGQDTADFVRQGYVDMIAPMMYTTTLTGPDSIEDYINTDRKYVTAVTEGKVPLVCFITTGVGSPVTPQQFKAVVDKVRSMGADGWIIWRYGGPGDGAGSGSPDIRNYLSLLSVPSEFTLSDVQTSVGRTLANITWLTDLIATSRVEYNTSDLFTASFRYLDVVGFNYWDLDYLQGMIIYDSTNVTFHQIVLTGLSPGTLYHFRVQSRDPSGTATSQVMTFTTNP